MYEPFTYASPGSARSGAAVVPHLMRMVAPKSVLDVGCGNGGWLKSFASHGVADFLGLDGPWVEPHRLAIPPDHFRVADLSKTHDVGRTFDLAITIEVAEHLDREYEKSFVKLLVNSAPVVLFSAAIPHQGGVHHVNEQWPEYWAELFAAEGYQVADAIRSLVWCDPEVEPCHAQNMFFYVRRDVLSQFPILREAAERTDSKCLGRVHPRVYTGVVGDFMGGCRPRSVTLSGYLKSGPVVLYSGAKRSLRRWLQRN
jgi:SAM-dependent methyltransferase